MNQNEQVKNNETDGVFIHGFFGIASPYWKTRFEDILIGLDPNIIQTIRTTVKMIGLQIYDILNFF